MRGAISLTRRTALRQWCESHMSQTMIAVFLASHWTGWTIVWKRPLPGLVSTRFRSNRDNFSASSAAKQGNTKVAKPVSIRKRVFLVGDVFMVNSLISNQIMSVVAAAVQQTAALAAAMPVLRSIGAGAGHWLLPARGNNY